MRNPHKTPAGKRRLLVGRTDGGRTLTLGIEALDRLIAEGRVARPSRRGLPELL